jgi:hypothetical protein
MSMQRLIRLLNRHPHRYDGIGGMQYATTKMVTSRLSPLVTQYKTRLWRKSQALVNPSLLVFYAESSRLLREHYRYPVPTQTGGVD